jgi:S1-C subfamily serine protease
MRVLRWLVAGVIGVIVAAGALAISRQTPAGTRPTFTVPLPQNHEVGVIVQDITPSIAAAFGLKEKHGAVITALDVGSLQAGDVIVSVNGQNVSSRRTLEAVLAGISPADSLIFQVSRNGAVHDIVIQKNAAGVSPDEDHPVPAAIAPGFRGVRVDNWSGGGLQTNGIVVTEVERGTPAEAANLRVGDVILDVNDLPVQNVEQFFSYVEKLSGQRVVLAVMRQGILSVVIVPSFY